MNLVRLPAKVGRALRVRRRHRCAFAAGSEIPPYLGCYEGEVDNRVYGVSSNSCCRARSEAAHAADKTGGAADRNTCSWPLRSRGHQTATTKVGPYKLRHLGFSESAARFENTP
ncbi:hypothetical protein ASA1KI_05910 [Opitutales bacterium ASA1]|nr:hypothetical protein ASA1KI_05910 [Opitutales bacterium ASA1]